MSDQPAGPENGGQDEAKKETAPDTFTGTSELQWHLAKLKASGTKFLTAEEILAADDRRYRLVETPEWGGEVIVRSLSGSERDRFENSLVQIRGKDRVMSTIDIRAKLCALAIVDPNEVSAPRQLFTEAQVAALGAKSATALARVYDVAAELAGISEADIEELSGNSDPASSDGSSSSSQ